MKTQKRVKEKKIEKKDILKDANSDHYFFVNDGTVLKNVLDLSKQLDKMSDEVFRYHVNDMKNDFASWIKEIFKEEKLAEELLKTTEKDKTQIIILKHIIKKFN
ncbi:hypothetical protein COY26_02760 [Candidatus Woesearchaeota archaeon CG_4_10_14_0_2_um_filter_33_10]|nr:MAG: hypothetical protein AUJ83_01365 [Candidatus Woesearchaeota archaeon CG1_02_33_12]PIN79214.1 MAG: hypothetical protein COV14_00305 [Candidatus Woesearchaeota archaeon CG10_big_fil_rev_8_21_14_0_10_33_12]PIZ53117.1 MAG: hypothetical protein COY26_02760 [Candidatus Woesearchaeota archaeon CG_4_10_14_0_2_um_filter_33_10]